MPKAGYLGTSNQFTFGMYNREKYTPLADWVCPSCNKNAAGPSVEARAITGLLIMGAVTVATFTWFVAGWGVI